MIVFRVALRKFGATARAALSGQSGFHADGRWHSRGRYLDYAAASRSLATLERLVHYKRFDSLAPHVIYQIDIPDTQIEIVHTFPPGWDAIDPMPAAQAIGDDWCEASRTPALRVPSAVTPGEFNLILNTRHPSWNWSWANGPDDFHFDSRLSDLLRH